MKFIVGIEDLKYPFDCYEKEENKHRKKRYDVGEFKIYEKETYIDYPDLSVPKN